VVPCHVARPSGPLKLQVISKIPGAFTMGITRRVAGQDDGSLVSSNRSQPVLNACPHRRTSGVPPRINAGSRP
jgi:hypothetical protein